MKVRVVKKTIKDFTNSYYTVRTKKIYNLIDQLNTKKSRYTLGGCDIIKEKNHIILKKEIKN